MSSEKSVTNTAPKPAKKILPCNDPTRPDWGFLADVLGREVQVPSGPNEAADALSKLLYEAFETKPYSLALFALMGDKATKQRILGFAKALECDPTSEYRTTSQIQISEEDYRDAKTVLRNSTLRDAMNHIISRLWNLKEDASKTVSTVEAYASRGTSTNEPVKAWIPSEGGVVTYLRERTNHVIQAYYKGLEKRMKVAANSISTNAMEEKGMTLTAAGFVSMHERYDEGDGEWVTGEEAEPEYTVPEESPLVGNEAFGVQQSDLQGAASSLRTSGIPEPIVDIVVDLLTTQYSAHGGVAREEIEGIAMEIGREHGIVELQEISLKLKTVRSQEAQAKEPIWIQLQAEAEELETFEQEGSDQEAIAEIQRSLLASGMSGSEASELLKLMDPGYARDHGLEMENNLNTLAAIADNEGIPELKKWVEYTRKTPSRRKSRKTAKAIATSALLTDPEGSAEMARIEEMSAQAQAHLRQIRVDKKVIIGMTGKTSRKDWPLRVFTQDYDQANASDPKYVIQKGRELLAYLKGAIPIDAQEQEDIGAIVEAMESWDGQRPLMEEYPELDDICLKYRQHIASFQQMKNAPASNAKKLNSEVIASPAVQAVMALGAERHISESPSDTKSTQFGPTEYTIDEFLACRAEDVADMDRASARPDYRFLAQSLHTEIKPLLFGEKMEQDLRQMAFEYFSVAAHNNPTARQIDYILASVQEWNPQKELLSEMVRRVMRHSLQQKQVEKSITRDSSPSPLQKTPDKDTADQLSLELF